MSVVAEERGEEGKGESEAVEAVEAAEVEAVGRRGELAMKGRVSIPCVRVR